MKRDAGWVTAILAVVTAVSVGTVGSRPVHEAAAAKGMATAGTPAGVSKPLVYQGPCEDLKNLLSVALGEYKQPFPAPASCAAVLEENATAGAADSNANADQCDGDDSGNLVRSRIPADKTKCAKAGSAAEAAVTAKRPMLRFMIATLPDPIHTHLSLVFDHETEALQEGAQDSEYTYDSSWMPWETRESHYPLVLDQDAAEERKNRREDQPGLLLFRRSLQRPPLPIEATTPSQKETAAGAGVDAVDTKPSGYDDLLIVFVVGEEPTAGIHREQFRNAAEWVRILGGLAAEKKAALLLAPSFSGSLPSLAQLLQEDKVHAALQPGAKQTLEIRSGQATSNIAVDWFLKQAKTKLADLNINFVSMQQDDDLMLHRYYDYLDAMKLGTCQLAIVSEDETAYGFSLDPVTQKKPQKNEQKKIRPSCETDGIQEREPPAFYYPRDIAALRTAYQEQSVFSGDDADASGGDGQHRTTLRTDLADPEGKEHDTIRSYAGSQTAMSEEAALLQITSMLRSHQSQFILLRSSNPLDQLFLAHFFKRTYPEGRVILTGNDLLLRRDVGRSGLNGIMTLSTYPLLPQIDDWTNWGLLKHSHRAFMQDGAMGVYTAMRFLLYQGPMQSQDLQKVAQLTPCADDNEGGEPGFLPVNNVAGRVIPDYANPFWMTPQRCRPLTWLTVLGNDGFWPIAALDWTPPKYKHSEKPLSLYERVCRWVVRTCKWMTAPLVKIARSGGAEIRGLSSPGDRIGLPGLPDLIKANAKLPYVPLSMNMALLMLMGWGCFHVFCCCSPSITVKPDHRSYFVRLKNVRLTDAAATAGAEKDGAELKQAPGKPRRGANARALLERLHPRSHEALIVTSSALLVMMMTTLAWGYGWLSSEGAPIFRPFLYELIPVVMWWLGAAAVLGNSFIEELMDGEAVSLRTLLTTPRSWKKGWPSVRRPFGWYAALTGGFYCLMVLVLDSDMKPGWRNLTYLRAMNLTNGLSPVMPIVLLLLGMYGWCWYALRGMALFDADRPLLPPDADLAVPGTAATTPPRRLLTMLGAEFAAQPLEDFCWPFYRKTWEVAGVLFFVIVVATLVITEGTPLRSLGTQRYSRLVCLWIALSMSVLLANLWQLSHLWLRLRSLLVFLDKLPLRRTLVSMHGFSWGSIWQMGGNVLDLRYKLFYRQFETLNHLQAAFEEYDPAAKKGRTAQPPLDAKKWEDLLQAGRKDRLDFSLWYAKNWDKWAARDLTALKQVQVGAARLGGQLLSGVLVPAWREETESLLVMPPEKGEEMGAVGTAMARRVDELERHVKHSEELVCLLYLGFVQNILGRMRAMVLGMVCLFLSIALVLPSYPFDPRPLLTGAVIFLFVAVSVVISTVYAQMFRDATLSHLTNTKPGELGTEFWMKLLSFGAGPLLGLMATVFPQLSDSVLSWLQPSLSAFK